MVRPTTPNGRRAQVAISAVFPPAQYGTYNCRHISSDPMRPWSQHAASEPRYDYYGNALDITHQNYGYSNDPTHQEWLLRVGAWLDDHRSDLSIRQILQPGDPAHSDHVHVDFWPKMKDNWWYIPPCQGGALVVVYADGSTDDTFGNLPPPPPPPEEGNVLERGDKGNAVENYQKCLLEWNPDALPAFGADGDFGLETEDWVIAYQRAANLDESGVIDGVTADLLGQYRKWRQYQRPQEEPPNQ